MSSFNSTRFLFVAIKTLLECVWMKVHLLKEEGGVSTGGFLLHIFEVYLCVCVWVGQGRDLKISQIISWLLRHVCSHTQTFSSTHKQKKGVTQQQQLLLSGFLQGLMCVCVCVLL